jgi:hypothetical protein
MSLEWMLAGGFLYAIQKSRTSSQAGGLAIARGGGRKAWARRVAVRGDGAEVDLLVLRRAEERAGQPDDQVRFSLARFALRPAHLERCAGRGPSHPRPPRPGCRPSARASHPTRQPQQSEREWGAKRLGPVHLRRPLRLLRQRLRRSWAMELGRSRGCICRRRGYRTSGTQTSAGRGKRGMIRRRCITRNPARTRSTSRCSLQDSCSGGSLTNCSCSIDTVLSSCQ